MQLRWNGSREIEAPVRRIWDRLLDPRVVARAAGADEDVVIRDPQHYTVTARIGVLMFKLPIALEVEIGDLVEEVSGRQRVRGTGHGTGLVATTDFLLQPLGPERTRLSWSAETTVQGRLAEFGAALVEPLIRRLTEDFWDAFAEGCR
ncbi:MAG TPA: SRPBCC domain-containing protein [Gemmatimonadales bacterium]|jgi:carbon monoxide dehydrogenase subunit G|nr:SRPBCC domain-containing protein [Gemmatimonadales bacterium]